MPKHKRKQREEFNVPVKGIEAPPKPMIDTVEPGPFIKDNLASLRDVTSTQLLNLRDEIADARARRLAIAANLEGWRDEINEAIAILRAHER
jgi:hypothetical protein